MIKNININNDINDILEKYITHIRIHSEQDEQRKLFHGEAAQIVLNSDGGPLLQAVFTKTY